MTDRLVVVGVDPGTTAAVAVLGLDGALVDRRSAKEFSKDRMIRFIVEHGKPLVAAADVTPAPSRVEELAANTGAALYVPDADLSADDKEALAEDAGVVTRDTHVRDAVAAAEHARRQYADLIEAARRRTRDAGVPDRFEDVVARVVLEGAALAEAVAAVQQPDAAGDDQEDAVRDERDWERIAARRQERVERLQDEVSRLSGYLEGDGEDGDDGDTVPLEELQRRNRRIRELREEVARKAARIEELEERNERLDAAVARLRSGWRFVPHVEDLADADGAVVAADGYDGGDVAASVETVLLPAPDERLRERGVRVVAIDDVETVAVPGGYVVAPDALQQDAADEAGDAFMAWLEDYREREAG